MIPSPAIVALLIGGAPYSPTDPSVLWEHLLEGDLVTIDRGRAQLEDRGVDINLGTLGLLHDITRLVRCLPLGPIPPGETDEYRAARQLVRLERIRLERLMRDGVHQQTAVDQLLDPILMFQDRPADQTHLTVRWPTMVERWPDEVPDPIPLRGKCPQRPGARAESDKKLRRHNKKLRAEAERRTVAEILPNVDHLPGHARAKLAYAYLFDVVNVGSRSFRIPEKWHLQLERALFAGHPPFRTAGGVILARHLEASNATKSALRLHNRLIADPTITDQEDSRVRVRLVGMLEPDWEAVLQVVDGVKGPRPGDWPALDNAHARALYALGRYQQLMTFGRRWLQSSARPMPEEGRKDLLEHATLLAPTDNPFHEQTQDILMRLGLSLPAGEAMAWIDEISPVERTARERHQSILASHAMNANRIDLAVAIYDRLRLDAAGDRKQRGPAATADEVRWIGARAEIEYAKNDAAAFAGFIDDLVAIARDEQAKPLARFAPHREVARLGQDYVGRLTNDVPTDPDRRKFAALLLEAAVLLSQKKTRWKPILQRYIPPLKILAGKYAVGRDGRAPKAVRKKKRPVRQLGEVVIPRLPPKLSAPDYETVLPMIQTYLVYEHPVGRWHVGAPWWRLAKKREEEKRSKN